MAASTNSVVIKISPASLATLNPSPHLRDRSTVRFLRSSSPRSIKLRSSSLPTINVKALESLETLSTEMHVTEIPRTVRIKFQLQKECSFGDQFLIVGDDPALGSWNPTNAVPLNWSEGHIWTVEMDLPDDLPIQFKFIHKDNNGLLQWQPGPDRVFRTWEAENTLVITEDWEDGEMQKITEEHMVMSDEQNHHDFSTNAKGNMETSITGGPTLMSGLSPLHMVPTSAEELAPLEYCGSVAADQNSMGVFS